MQTSRARHRIAALPYIDGLGEDVNRINIPVAPHIIQSELTAGDPDPMFVTLKILEVGETPRGWDEHWTLEGVQNVASQINTNTVTGITGHASDGWEFDLPILHWIGAQMEGTSLYAKAYVPTYATEVREYLRTAVALGQRIGTSVDMFWGESGTVQDGNLVSLDLVHPDMAALEAASVVPELSRASVIDEGAANMPENSKTNERATASQELLDVREAQVAELREQLAARESELAGVREALGMAADSPDPVHVYAQATMAEVQKHRSVASAAEVIEHIGETAKGNDVLAGLLRQLVLEQDGSLMQPDVASAKARVAAAMETDAFRAIASGRSQLTGQHGPAVGVPPAAAKGSEHKVERNDSERSQIQSGSFAHA